MSTNKRCITNKCCAIQATQHVIIITQIGQTTKLPPSNVCKINPYTANLAAIYIYVGPKHSNSIPIFETRIRATNTLPFSPQCDDFPH